MWNIIRKYFDIKFNKPNMYILNTKIINNDIIFRLVIHGENLKEYRITLKKYEYNEKLLYTIILSIILLEDISTIYYDPWNNINLIEFISNFRWIKLEKWRANNQMEDNISKDNIIDIQIN